MSILQELHTVCQINYQFSRICSIGKNKQTTILSLAVTVLRFDAFHFLAVTPYEILVNNGLDPQALNTSNNRLPSIPIECLNDAEIAEKFVKR